VAKTKTLTAAAIASDNRHYPARGLDSNPLQILCEARRFSDDPSKTSAPSAPDARVPALQISEFVDGRFVLARLAVSHLQNAWTYLSGQQEINPHLLDDVRIAQLCLLNLATGKADPWRLAFWSYMGIVPEKWVGIQAEREAYVRSLGPSLAEQLQDPTFLASLDASIRASLSPYQTKLAFPPSSAFSRKSNKRKGVA